MTGSADKQRLIIFVLQSGNTFYHKTKNSFILPERPKNWQNNRLKKVMLTKIFIGKETLINPTYLI